MSYKARSADYEQGVITFEWDPRALTLSDVENARKDLGTRLPERFDARYDYFMTPAELRELKADPERWALYQAYLSERSEAGRPKT